MYAIFGCMPNHSPDIVVFKRDLSLPKPEVISALSVALMHTVTKYMPISDNTVRFMDPNKISIPIVGGNFIEHSVQNAAPDSELTYLGYDEIADRIHEQLASLPSFSKKVGTACLNHSLQGGQPDRKIFCGQLARSSMHQERQVSQETVKRLGNKSKSNKHPQIHVGWLKFYTECPPSLEVALQAVANQHIPPDTVLTFGYIRRARQGDEIDYLTGRPSPPPQ